VLHKGGKAILGNEKFYCSVPGAGIDPKIGRSDVPKPFAITPEGLEANTTKSIPKFNFAGQISSVNCCFYEPFDGYIVVGESEYSIKSLEV